MLGVHQQRHLVRPERALDLQAVDDLGAGSSSTPSTTTADPAPTTPPYRLLTTILDPADAPAPELAALYAQR